jgi:hypothetical protein
LQGKMSRGAVCEPQSHAPLRSNSYNIIMQHAWFE